MRKQINANEGIADLMLGVGKLKSIGGSNRKRLLNDALYYTRKLLKIIRSAQSIPEGTEDLELKRLEEDLNNIKEEVDKLEQELNK